MTTTTTIDGYVDEFLGTWACTNPCHLCSESLDLLRIILHQSQADTISSPWSLQLLSLPFPPSSLLMTMIIASTPPLFRGQLGTLGGNSPWGGISSPPSNFDRRVGEISPPLQNSTGGWGRFLPPLVGILPTHPSKY